MFGQIQEAQMLPNPKFKKKNVGLEDMQLPWAWFKGCKSLVKNVYIKKLTYIIAMVNVMARI